MNVRAFTADKSSGLDPNIRGSYLGVIDKVMTSKLDLNNGLLALLHNCIWNLIFLFLDYFFPLCPS